MRPRPKGLPDYGDPPVGEVVLSAQFQPLPKLQITHLGLYWALVRELFPTTQMHGPVEPAFESFDQQTASPGLSVRISLAPTQFPRVWLVSSDGTELLQIQQDRFILNWRKVRPTDVYPRYEHIRERFETHFRGYQEFLLKEKVIGAPLESNQVEVTYLNQIQSGRVWTNHSELHKVLRVYQPIATNNVLGDPESVFFRSVTPLLFADDSKPTARMHVEVNPANAISDRSPLILVSFLVRGAPRAQDIAGVVQFMDFARDKIVRTFDLITTPDMHAVWGKRG